MKLSAGLTRIGPTIAFLVLFVAGALIQALAMRRADLAVAYIFVLGAEAALTLLLSIVLLHEAVSWQRIGAVALVVIGIALLHRS